MAPILSLADLTDAVADARARGRRVVLANGCFDVLHVGHIRYLQGARREGDVLVVAVNHDEAVRELKGEGRPILRAEERAEIVAALEGVDYVTIFSGPTVAPVIDAIQPDTHCKGTDYTVESVPERALVTGYGGRTVIVGDVKMHSTRDLIAEVLARLDPGESSRRQSSAGDSPAAHASASPPDARGARIAPGERSRETRA